MNFNKILLPISSVLLGLLILIFSDHPVIMPYILALAIITIVSLFIYYKALWQLLHLLFGVATTIMLIALWQDYQLLINVDKNFVLIKPTLLYATLFLIVIILSLYVRQQLNQIKGKLPTA